MKTDTYADGSPKHNDPIPDTDLVRIAEREVIEKAKNLARVENESLERQAGIEHLQRWTAARHELLAAVSLLESRERLLREGKS